MRIKKIHLRNLGPISSATIEPRFSEVGHPIPMAIVGQNGAGKSLALSVVLDAMTEARRGAFREIQEVGATDYLRLSSKNYIQQSAGFSHAQTIFSSQDGDLQFDEIVSNIPYADFANENPTLLSLPTLDSGEFKDSGFYKQISATSLQKKHVRELPFLYFPYFRYEPAYWMNEKAKIDFIKSDNYLGHSKINSIRTNIIEETKRWILNILLDRELYEKIIQNNTTASGVTYSLFLGYAGPNTQLFNLVNEVISTMLKSKNKKITSARIGIGRKGNREIKVYATQENQPEEIVAPDISQLSSGELMTLGLATEIIRAYELIKGTPPESLNDVRGVVLVDEIDLHLHISFQKSVLPQIIRKFPNVQFIFTTHSPFFLLGMADSGDIDIINLPLGNKISTEEFNEFQAGYNFFITKNEQFQQRYEELESQAKIETRPLVITEGKTDWKHLKFALQCLKNVDEHTALLLDFFEFENEVNMGDTKLSQMCEHMAALPQKRKMIFVFDRDNPSITKSMSGAPQDFKSWGNNVYSICLPIPQHRTEYKNLSIELYYTDETLRRADPTTGKRLWFTNEIEIVTRPTSGQKLFRALDIPCQDDEFEKKVFDQPADQIIDATGRLVGLSKAAFSEIIIRTDTKASPIDLSAFSGFFCILGRICDMK